MSTIESATLYSSAKAPLSPKQTTLSQLKTEHSDFKLENQTDVNENFTLDMNNDFNNMNINVPNTSHNVSYSTQMEIDGLHRDIARVEAMTNQGARRMSACQNEYCRLGRQVQQMEDDLRFETYLYRNQCDEFDSIYNDSMDQYREEQEFCEWQRAKRQYDYNDYDLPCNKRHKW